MSKPIIILAIPEDCTDELLEDSLSAPFDNGYYLAMMLEPRDGNLRALFRRTANHVAPAEQASREAARAAEDEKAIALIKAHPNLALARTVGLLTAKGIKRSQGWVATQRSRMVFTTPQSR